MKKDIRRFDAKQELMEEKLDVLRDTIMGRDNSFLPFITDENGRFTEEKLEAFVNELSDGVFKSKLYGVITDKKFIEACKCFLYCALQGIAEYDDEYRRVLRANSTFSDIVKIARHKNNLLFIDREKVQKYEFDTQGYDISDVHLQFINEFQLGGFFRYSDIAYRLLTGRDIPSVFSKEDYSRYYDADELERAQIYGFDTVEEYRQWDAEGDEFEKSDEYMRWVIEDNENMDPRQKELNEMQFGSWKNEIALSEQLNAEWRSTVVSPERFAEKYLRYRELFWEMNTEYKYRLFEHIEFMADYFLYNHDMSALSDNRNAAAADHRIEKLCMAVRQSIKGALRDDKE
ncbi:MAG: hypothetical protein IJZ72_03380 [Oscillospiraceae bacterium]|nr:hypothetical protein [Oscillospiraceae bacterium]